MTASRLDQPHLVLVGLMGAGKSTVGRALAERLQRPFIDVDLAIEAATGQTVRQLWSSGGEAAYRDLERDTVLATVARTSPVVLAAPGGVVLEESVRRALEGPDVVIVWLRGDVGTIASRLRRDDHRPLLGDHPAEVLGTLALARVPYYEQLADVVVDIDGLDPNAVTAKAFAGLAPMGVRAPRPQP
jgi:shikimate kinase